VRTQNGTCVYPLNEMAEGKKSKKLSGVIDFAYEEFKTDEVKLLQWAKCKKCKAVIREAKKMLPPQETTAASDLACSSNTSPYPVDVVRQPQQVAVSLPSKSKKMKLFDFMVPGALSARCNIVRDQDQPDPSRDFHRLLN
jgi:hypothetical protein